MDDDPRPSHDDPAQERLREWFLHLGDRPWLTLYSSIGTEGISCGTFCGLAPPSYRGEAVRDPAWDLMHGGHGPGFSQDGAGVATYERFYLDPLEPLVIEHEFHGVRPSYNELSEEFRLFHNLYQESATGRLLKFDDAGIESVAAYVDPDRVRVLTPLIRQYQAARQLDLLLFIDSVVYYDSALSAPPEQEWRGPDVNAVLHTGTLESSGGKPFSRFLATRVLGAPPIEQSGIWPYEHPDDHYPEFIIDADEFGRPRRFTCEPDKLANYFGANPGAPHYLTPVHFRRDVLVKYYNRPDLYSVEDGYLRCGALWGLRMDNDTAESVVVWLGDLGRDLPAAERDYWLSFNSPPRGGISETAFRRAILAQPAAAQSNDLRFRVAYERLRGAWRDRFGWPLFLDPEPGDAHLLDQVRRPLHDTDAELEALVGILSKLLVDSLNEAELARPLPPGPKDEKGISKLSRWLDSNGYPDTEVDIKFLRALQAVRSEAVAHRKGSDSDKALDRLFDARRRAAAGDHLLERSVQLVTNLLAFADQTS